MNGLKESKQALGAEVIAGPRRRSRPPPILAQASQPELLDAAVQPDRHERAWPAVPAVRAWARDAARRSPVAFLPENHALAIAIMSYNGQMNFGLLGHFDALPDIDTIAEGITEELATLMRLARESQTANVEQPTAPGARLPMPGCGPAPRTGPLMPRRMLSCAPGALRSRART